MADFEVVHKAPSGYKTNIWKANRNKEILYVSECYLAEDGREFTCKSKKGNMFMMPVSISGLPAYILFLQDTLAKLAPKQPPPPDDDVPF